ncbi:rhamnogalacturonan acetylesterase [Sphingobacterium bovistauri]|uniref:Rhamnogalacturonan acetylesterase n=1 Tax=Sphingobacterium bovistauri TaxID=2781959 RepID=A0ABS7Z103_9SPHI|nr:rhamnogalacturonan acetylesterase [Sphingobacterium bovistauri]MCA5003847.1 rhamnogalacturonan acetylesterase [Sphingobacterium bovistauri]
MKVFKLLFITLIGLVSLSYLKPKPTIYIIGDSTVRNSNKEYWGWGTLFSEFLDTAKIRVSNHAMAGRSTRTFVKEGRWAKVDSSMKAGDYLFIQFGHNEGSSPDTSRRGYRGVLRGIGQDSVVLDWGNNQYEVVRTYGENLRRMVKQAKSKGVQPILFSMIPRNQWDAQAKVKRANQDFGLWARQIAEAEQVPFIDLNELTAKKYDQLGAEAVKSKYFPGDHTHTNYDGAMENAASVIDGLIALKHPIIKYLNTF